MQKPQAFRKLPIEILAIQFVGTPPDGTNLEAISRWLRKYDTESYYRTTDDDDLIIGIPTLEGEHE